jgi:hypothetical protein
MGVDVQILIRRKAGSGLPDNDSRVEGYFAPLEGWEVEDYPFADAGLSSMTRYYGGGYERGPWPDICARLLNLMAHPGVEGVWYFGDNRGGYEEYDRVTLGKLGEMNAHYVANGHEPYCGAKLR